MDRTNNVFIIVDIDSDSCIESKVFNLYSRAREAFLSILGEQILTNLIDKCFPPKEDEVYLMNVDGDPLITIPDSYDEFVKQGCEISLAWNGHILYLKEVSYVM